MDINKRLSNLEQAARPAVTGKKGYVIVNQDEDNPDLWRTNDGREFTEAETESLKSDYETVIMVQRVRHNPRYNDFE